MGLSLPGCGNVVSLLERHPRGPRSFGVTQVTHPRAQPVKGRPVTQRRLRELRVQHARDLGGAAGFITENPGRIARITGLFGQTSTCALAQCVAGQSARWPCRRHVIDHAKDGDGGLDVGDPGPKADAMETGCTAPRATAAAGDGGAGTARARSRVSARPRAATAARPRASKPIAPMTVMRPDRHASSVTAAQSAGAGITRSRPQAPT